MPRLPLFAPLLLALALGCGGASPGRAANLTSSAELAAIARAAAEGDPAAVEAQRAIRKDAARPWRWGEVGGRFATATGDEGKACHPAAEPDQADALKEGAPDALARALAYALGRGTDPKRRLALAAEARARVLDLVDAEGFDGPPGSDWNGRNQCILDLAISIPVWIETALLLEDTPVWTRADRTSFARWLARAVYPRVAWASRVRRNNWGAAGSLSASLIARYVASESLSLEEVEPEPRRLDAPSAWKEHDDLQRARIATVWRGDSDCRRFGIQDHGGIPDELRRGAGGCDAAFLRSKDDAAHSYQTMHVELLAYHAEALRRAGDDSLFAARTAAGDPAILQAILFVIDNPTPGGRSFSWGSRSGALAVAFRAYGDSRLRSAAQEAETFRGGRTLPYAGIALGEEPPGSPTNAGADPEAARPAPPVTP